MAISRKEAADLRRQERIDRTKEARANDNGEKDDNTVVTYETPASGAFIYTEMQHLTVRCVEEAVEIDAMMREPGPFLVVTVSRSIGETNEGPFVRDPLRVRKAAILAYG